MRYGRPFDPSPGTEQWWQENPKLAAEFGIDDNIVTEVSSHIWEREEHEHYVEPLWCSARLFQVVPFYGSIRDPACGFGHIVLSARRRGYTATGADIVSRGFPCRQENFLHSVKPQDNIVCNPPFNLFREFAEHALVNAQKKVAMIWTIRTLPAARWLEHTPLEMILFLTPRPSMPPGHVIAAGGKPGGGKQDFCWLIWNQAHRGPAQVGWLHRDGLNAAGGKGLEEI